LTVSEGRGIPCRLEVGTDRLVRGKTGVLVSREIPARGIRGMEVARAQTEEPNARRRRLQEAAIFLRQNGAAFVRGVYHKRSGWWSADGVYLGYNALDAKLALHGNQEQKRPHTAAAGI
jgi:hypothetical protein